MHNKQILVLGGAGYIGSHITERLSAKGYKVIVLDNLYSGHIKSIDYLEDRVIIADITQKTLHEVHERFGKIDGIIHFAGYIEVGESMKNPYKYIQNNISRSAEILEFMKDADIKSLVFSSSAAVYGDKNKGKITERTRKKPINVYGLTKSVFEDILFHYDNIFGVKSICLRYFNAAGASHFRNIGEDHPNESHLIPLVLKTALGQRDTINIYGDDYNTPDGTCIRDYIHVDDLAEAHIFALETLMEKQQNHIFNLGVGRGYSIKEIIDISKKITKIDIPSKIADRRDGDPAILVADADLIFQKLGWKAKYDIKDIIKTAWNWHSKNPEGFKDLKK
jgi:UDP-glucose 4-epimerase